MIGQGAFSGFCVCVGAWILGGMSGIGSRTIFARDVLSSLWQARPRWKTILPQLIFIGVQSLPVVLVTGAFTGMVLAYSSYFQFQALGVTSWVGPLVAKGLSQQLAPTLVGLMLAGRVGCSMAAELGNMAITEQIAAVRTLGVDHIGYLAAPRALASTVMAPLLTAFGMFLGIGAGLALTVYGLDADPHFIWQQTQAWMGPFDIIRGLIKSCFFGFTTAIICCHEGITASGGAEGVGRATTDANVYSCVTILTSNLLLTMVLTLFE